MCDIWDLNMHRPSAIEANMSNSPAQVRTATPQDLDSVADLHTRARTDYYRGFVDEAELTDPARATARHNYWARILRSADHTVFIAHKAGNPVGFAMIGACAHPDPDPRVTSEMHLYVDPGSFRQGIGTDLHRVCVQAWQAASVTTARLWVQGFNQRAQNFYRSQGWAPDGHHRPDSTGLLGYILEIPAA
ncbi:GNAT family N-acetyltransferase [Actinomadura logoneensis]|uniref:GNAT family N-acetyltransferase n=1 Tax=Actinomadura logoneensis TaxID=2293572 RepID=A0A372JJH9_9ACTN|nr:GNAT family N-acetyltransferase [Actinomadura logoneensis]RFU40177.1 GNAT family N-acetyltransferase [Actinomadura logoneensis]